MRVAAIFHRIPSTVGQAVLATLVVGVALIGCHDAPAAPELADAERAAAVRPLAGKGSVDAHSRAILAWAVQVDTSPAGMGAFVAAGIRGDDRSVSGAPATTTAPAGYQGNLCGVYAVLASQAREAGELNLDPDANYTSTMAASCGAARLFGFHVDGLDAPPRWTGPHSIARGLYTLGVGESRVQWQGFGVRFTNCTGLRFDDLYAPESSSLLQTRLVDTVVTAADGTQRPARRWRIRSRPPHRAMCILKSNKGEVPTGVTHFLPFELAVTEVPYPSPTYP